MKIIEFTGNPGSGKSTINKELHKYHSEFGKSIYTKDSIKSKLMSNVSVRSDLFRKLHSIFKIWPKYRRWFSDYEYLRIQNTILPKLFENHHEILREVFDAVNSNSAVEWQKEYTHRRRVPQSKKPK